MLVLVGGLGFFDLHPTFAVVTVVVAAPVAIGAFGLTVAAVWRGPPVVEFSPEDALRCDAQESEPVRAYAQLRGLIGGAGHVYPARLAFPAVSWSAAVVAGLHGVSPALGAAGPSPVALAVAAAVGAWVFPARPYWYREVMGGGALVSPPEAVAALAARERSEGAPGIAAVHEKGRAVPILRDARPRAATRAGHPMCTRRSPRYNVLRTLVVEQSGRGLEVATLNVSDGGLAVRWPGALPMIGDSIVINLEQDVAGCRVDAVVCWRWPEAKGEPTVGLELCGEGRERTVWREFVNLATGAVAVT